MLRTLYGDDGVTGANGADANGGIMRRVSGNAFSGKTRFSNRANDHGGYHKRGAGDGDGGAFTATPL